MDAIAAAVENTGNYGTSDMQNLCSAFETQQMTPLIKQTNLLVNKASNILAQRVGSRTI
jgi:hypothetical protein